MILKSVLQLVSQSFDTPSIQTYAHVACCQEYEELQASLVQAQALSSRAEVTARYCQQVPKEELRQLRQVRTHAWGFRAVEQEHKGVLQQHLVPFVLAPLMLYWQV